MGQYIDKATVVALIENRMKLNEVCQKISENEFYHGAIDEAKEILSLLDTIEVKEMNEVPANVMINQSGNKYVSSWSGLMEYDNFKANEEIKILIPNK